MKKFTIVVDGYDNCCCNICFRVGKVAKIKYYTHNYGSNNRPGKICKNLQKHPHSIWICQKCMEDFRSEWNRSTRGLGFEYPKFYGKQAEEGET